MNPRIAGSSSTAATVNATNAARRTITPRGTVTAAPRLKQRFTKEGLRDVDRQMITAAIAIQIDRHCGQDWLPVLVNGRTERLSPSMAVEQLQLFVHHRSSGTAPPSLTPRMHASLQLWHNAVTSPYPRKLWHSQPWVLALNKIVANELQSAGPCPLRTAKISARGIEAAPIALGVPVPPQADSREAAPRVRKPVVAATPLPYSDRLHDLGPVIDATRPPPDEALLRLCRSQRPGFVIAAVEIEGGKLLLQPVRASVQFQDGIELAAKKIREHDKMRRLHPACISVKALKARCIDEQLLTII